jgi:Raf kinase inhibitor-like YbhB/YbcL family protein
MRYLIILMILFFPVYALAMDIKSDAFENSLYIPSEYTCESQDISPALKWSSAPMDTKSFVLICDDPDAPGKTWSHWVIFNMPKDKTSLPENVAKIGTLDDGSIQGINDFGKSGYQGPCPPPGGPHRYFFKLYALDIVLTLDENATRDDVLQAIQGHVIGEAQLYGIYQR